jgi:hypothetical protein
MKFFFTKLANVFKPHKQVLVHVIFYKKNRAFFYANFPASMVPTIRKFLAKNQSITIKEI